MQVWFVFCCEQTSLAVLKRVLIERNFHKFIRKVRSSGNVASISILQIRNPTKFTQISFDSDSIFEWRKDVFLQMLCCKKNVLTYALCDKSDIIICQETENSRKIRKFLR